MSLRLCVIFYYFTIMILIVVDEGSGDGIMCPAGQIYCISKGKCTKECQLDYDSSQVIINIKLFLVFNLIKI